MMMYAAVLLDALVTVTIWLQLSESTNGCTLCNACLPLKTQLADLSQSQQAESVRPGESVTVTCHTDCNGMNLTGCNVTDDWIAIVTDTFGNVQKYNNIKHTSRSFRNDSGISLINYTRKINQSDFCNGTSSLEKFSATLHIGNNPRFNTILISCGLGRFGTLGYQPFLIVHDFSSVVQIDLDQYEITTTGTTTVTASESAADMDMLIVVFSNDTDQQPLLLLNSGNNSKNITCTKTNGSFSELRVQTVDQTGIVTSELLNTIAGDRKIMKDLGVEITDREVNVYTETGYAWQDFDIILENVYSNMILQCGAKATENGKPIFYRRLAITVFDSDKELTIIFSNDTDNHPYLTLQKSGRITCIKRSGYISDAKVQLLTDAGSISNDHSELTISMNQEQLKQLGVSIRESINHSESLWQDFDIIFMNINSIMAVQCGATSLDGTYSKFYDRVIVTVATTSPCFDTDERTDYIASISSVPAILLLIIGTLIVTVLILVYVLGCRKKRKGTKVKPKATEASGAVERRECFKVMAMESLNFGENNNPGEGLQNLVLSNTNTSTSTEY